MDRLLADHELPRSCLRLEATETLVDADPQGVRDAVAELRDLGVLAWLDDFGTGASSLTFLQRFSGDALKLDRSFTAALQRDRSAVRVVRAMVGLAHDLGLQVVAEGVETPARLRLLRSPGCDLLQGFHLGRPVDAAAAGAAITEC